MSLATTQPTGFRRLTLTMLAARDRADAYKGMPQGSAKPLTILAAFQEAEPYLGLPSQAFKLVSWLVKQTMAQDWEQGSRPIAWPSARRVEEYMNLSKPRIKALNRALYEAGIFIMRDNEQGKRYGRRDAHGHIVEAYGFDLSPLAFRFDEFIQVAARARREREYIKALRKRATIARRAICQAGETLAMEEAVPAEWKALEQEASEICLALRRVSASEDIEVGVKAIERRQKEAEDFVRALTKTVDTNPSGVESEPHTTSTNNSYNPPDTVMDAEKGSSGRDRAPMPAPSQTARGQGGEVKPPIRVKPGELLDLAPRLAQYVQPGRTAWPDLLDAAGALRTELGISAALWGEACKSMGRETAILSLVIVSTKENGHFTRSAGGYFAGMIKKFGEGELHLDRSLWKLREQKWGAPDERRPQ